MNRIKALREDRDLRQIDVSLATGIDQRTLSNYETGKTNPDSYAIIKLADYFDVSADFLIGRDNDYSLKVKKLAYKINEIRKELDLILDEMKSM